MKLIGQVEMYCPDGHYIYTFREQDGQVVIYEKLVSEYRALRMADSDKEDFFWFYKETQKEPNYYKWKMTKKMKKFIEKLCVIDGI